MKTLAITDFKAHALQVLGQVAKTRESVVVTKRGKPLAEVVPFSASKPAMVFGMRANEICTRYARLDMVEHAATEALGQGAVIALDPQAIRRASPLRHFPMGVQQAA